ncbi:MAG: hypothetical protein SOZ80_02835 [Prevotella sp.]|uniref:hypothetical protein n=1 Tax=Prevotella sp. TaxID=59823 RepID=UPI002A2FCFA3|nr:hypothetical protein [Prevotella sp.]MDD7318295.1 hypothetical protein [Prevotellaceae bacterium]MDY4019701.1 hypothetical protein [Prevotella sp.]
MKKLLLLCLAGVAMMIIAGCEGQNTKNNKGNGDSLLTDSTTEQDSSLYGKCGEDCAMNTLQLISDKGDTVYLSYDPDADRSPVRGGIAVGDRVAVQLGKDAYGETIAASVINITTLLGKWQSLDRNFEIKEGGVVETVVNEQKPYTSWKIVNGKLVLGTDTFKIYELGADSLYLENKVGIFAYKRLK